MLHRAVSGSAPWVLNTSHWLEAPDDSQLLYALGLAHVELDETDLASAYLQRAIDAATRHSDIRKFQMELERVRGGEQVGS